MQQRSGGGNGNTQGARFRDTSQQIHKQWQADPARAFPTVATTVVAGQQQQEQQQQQQQTLQQTASMTGDAASCSTNSTPSPSPSPTNSQSVTWGFMYADHRPGVEGGHRRGRMLQTVANGYQNGGNHDYYAIYNSVNTAGEIVQRPKLPGPGLYPIEIKIKIRLDSRFQL
ncbi:hypothetical protein TSAR_009085 [Trichomalopsis sarcophagae]|uniref:Uncharacterized protein n=1 Tax=Trichomalopsis sarcophagae TaxID=543379 RepID=A0A232FLQ4_9HYME|nr:hypothetical protein TSAR_009085 [Trichomalopsis sarcophagae]